MKKHKAANKSSKYGSFTVFPRETCHKCGKKYWQHCVMPKTWSCIYCGNMIYFNYGTFKQQIDLAFESGRRNEYVKSSTGKAILPRVGEDIKNIRFNVWMENQKKSDRVKAKVAESEQCPTS